MAQGLSWANIVLVLLGTGCNASASVLVQYGLSTPHGEPRLADPLSILANRPLLVAVILYIGAFALYAAALARLPLNVVHPVTTSAAIMIVAIMSKLLFGEPLPWTSVTGIGLVIAGVWLITLRIA